MSTYIQDKNKRREIAIKEIINSFCDESFTEVYIRELQSLVLDDVHLSQDEIEYRKWNSIYCDTNGGAIDVEINSLIKWWINKDITPIYATSRQRIVENSNGVVLLMKFHQIDASILNQIELGMWMFGEIPELAARRVSDWRADIWFSNPLEFIVLSEHDGYGTTTIAGSPELIESIKASATHGLYEWKDGVVPDWNKGAAFPETRVPPEKRTSPPACN